MSDHAPIYAKVLFENYVKVEHSTSRPMSNTPKPKWKNATMDQKLEFNDILFRKMLDLSLTHEIPKCYDLHCKDKVHIDKIDVYTHNLLNSLNDAAHETIPCSTFEKETTYQRKSTPAGHNLLLLFKIRQNSGTWFGKARGNQRTVNCII